MICIDCAAEFIATGKGGRCLACRRIWDRNWRARRKAEGRPVEPTKMPREYHRAYEARYYTSPQNRARRNALMRGYAKAPETQEHHRARWAARRLTKQPCEVCGAAKVEAHHDDYSRPLDVRWLCPPHHRELHAKAEERP